MKFVLLGCAIAAIYFTVGGVFVYITSVAKAWVDAVSGE